MHQSLRIVITLCSVVVLAACSSLMPVPTPTATSLPPSTALPEQSNMPSAAISTPESTDMPMPSSTPTEASAPATVATPFAVGEPASSWNDIPIMPQANPGTEDQSGYSYTVKATVKEVRDFYDREMSKLGWQPFASGTGGTGSVILLYQKDSKTITIGVAPQGDMALVLITQS